MLLGTAAARAADASLGQDAAHGGSAQVNALPFAEKFGQVAVIGPGVLGAGQPHHRVSLGFLDGVVRPTASITMDQSCCSLLSVGLEEPPGVSLGYPENLGSLGNGDLVFQDVVEHVQSRQISLFQCHILHGWTFSLTS